MNISAAAKAAHLTVKTVRYYADIGLVPAPYRSVTGYRVYDMVALQKLIFVRRSREFGFSIEECRELLGLYEKSAPFKLGCEANRLEKAVRDQGQATGVAIAA